MQIELIGCTSAGKSTLIRHILQSCRSQGLNIVPGDDFVLKQIRLNWLKSHWPRTLTVDLMALFACLITWRKNREFYLFATRFLFQLPIALLDKLNLLRNILKKIGIYEIIHFRRADQQIILVDEGVLQAAHNLFVHGSVQIDLENISTFVQLVPLPDIIVYLRQPESQLIDRTMKRGHKRIPDRSYHHVAPFIKQAITTFDKLAQHPAVESKLLIIDGEQQVKVIAGHQDDPQMGLVLKIIRSGLAADTIARPAVTPYAQA